MAGGPRAIDPERLPRLRAAAQLLHRPVSGGNPAQIAKAIAGAQAQDDYAARLTFRSRSRRLTAADVDRARTQERSLLRSWVMRMTIHLIPTEDAGWMLPLFEPRIDKWSRRRLGQLGISPDTQEKALREIARMLESDGPLTRGEVAQRLVRSGIPLNQQIRTHIFRLANTSGIACLGPDRGRSACLVRREDWLGKLPRFDLEMALAELARRYLGGFGPATERDFAKWSGLGLTDIRRGLEAIAGDLTEVRIADEPAVMLRGGEPRLPRAGQIGLLGAFDTYVLGYWSREFALAPRYEAEMKRGGGGWIRPVIVRDGVVIGVWGASRKGNRIEISLNEPRSMPAEALNAIESEVADIGRFEGVEATLATG